MARYVSEIILDMEENIENAKFLYLQPPSYLESYDEQLVLRTDEGKYCPLYIISNDKDPYLTESITFWQKDYASLNQLWLSSYKELEPLIVKQLSDLDSDISVKGRKISKRIKKFFKKQVFYPVAEELFLNSSEYIRPNYLKCPSCTQNWKLETTFHGIFDFKCDKCLLLGYELLVDI